MTDLRLKADIRRHHRRLSREEEQQLARDGSPQAKETLVYSILPLAITRAARPSSTADFDDLAAVAMAACITAVETFDPDRGNRLSTHALWTIRGAVSDESRRALAPSGTRAPHNVYDLANKARRIAADLHCEPGDDRVAEQLGTTGERLRSALGALTWALAFDVDDDDDEDAPRALHERLGAPPAQEPSQLGPMLRERLGRLQEAQREVLELGVEGLNQTQIAERMGLTRQRICQLRTAALRALR